MRVRKPSKTIPMSNWYHVHGERIDTTKSKNVKPIASDLKDTFEGYSSIEGLEVLMTLLYCFQLFIKQRF